jgi:hypothetical protein
MIVRLRCPNCREEGCVGTNDTILACAKVDEWELLLEKDGPGTLAVRLWNGHTEVFWDSQTTSDDTPYTCLHCGEEFSDPVVLDEGGNVIPWTPPLKPTKTKQKVWVVEIQHKLGTDIRVCASKERAHAELDDWARRWWNGVFPGTKCPEETGVAAEDYFGPESGEYFEVTETEVLG